MSDGNKLLAVQIDVHRDQPHQDGRVGGALVAVAYRFQAHFV